MAIKKFDGGAMLVRFICCICVCVCVLCVYGYVCMYNTYIHICVYARDMNETYVHLQMRHNEHFIQL
jgi:hypothetical protein